MDQILFSAAKQLEQQLDTEIDRLDNLGTDDLESIRERRLKEMKLRQEKIIKWKQNVRTRKQSDEPSRLVLIAPHIVRF